MRNFQKNKNSMMVTIRDFLRLNVSIITSLPGFMTLLTLFSENLEKIIRFIEMQETDKSGITQNKMHLKNRLLVKALDISWRLIAYAKMNDNLILASEVNYNKAEMKRSGAAMLKNLAILLYDKAQVHVAELTEYGITTETLAAFKADIDQFSTVLPAYRLSISDRKLATVQLAQLLADNDKLLDKMDALIETVKTDHPEFYHTYRNNRKVIINGNGSLVLTGKISDAVTREGIRGVKVTFRPTNGLTSINAPKSETAMVKVTANKGRFRVKSMKPGTYNAVLFRQGYKEKLVTVQINPGERTVLNEELESE